ncbi:MAG: hypothetical protein WC305_08065 [Bacteroidales bacterium]|nr:hypothetical protein [Bacteroidales bacterium]
MFFKHRFLFLPLLFLLFVTDVFSQGGPDYRKYIETAGDVSVLYRGKQATKYPFLHNGTYYWFGPKYEEGNLIYNGKEYFNLMMNIDAFQNELLLKHNNNILEVSLNGDLVTSFTLGNKLFLNLSKLGYDVPAGFYLELYSGKDKLYKNVKKVFSDRIHVGYYDYEFNPDILKDFAPEVSYYLLKDGIISKIGSKKSLIKSFPDKKRIVRRYIRKNDLDLERNFDVFSIKVLNFIESGNE